jgi:DNA-binding NtrC family response regulator
VFKLPRGHSDERQSCELPATESRHLLAVALVADVSHFVASVLLYETGVRAAIHNKFILVIDDDVGMLRALTKVLNSEGCVVAGAANSARAMQFLMDHNQAFDLIITDIRMPLVDGLKILELVKSQRPDIPVIVITAFGGAEAQAEAARLGAAAYLEKPLDTAALLAAVERALPRTNGPSSV